MDKKCQCVFKNAFLDCLAFEDGTDMLSRNVGNYKSTLRNTTEERRSHGEMKLERAIGFAREGRIITRNSSVHTELACLARAVLFFVYNLRMCKHLLATASLFPRNTEGICSL
jgi:hypothetical protein